MDGDETRGTGPRLRSAAPHPTTGAPLQRAPRPTDAGEVDASKVDAALVDATKTGATKADVAKADVTKVDATKADATKADATKADGTKADATKADGTKADVTRADATKVDVTKTDAGRVEAAKVDGTKVDGTKPDGTGAGAATVAGDATAPAGHRRSRFAHALRRASSPRSVGRAVVALTRRPGGRLAVPGLLLLAVLTATGAAGAFLVPATADRVAEPAPSPTASEWAPPTGFTVAPTTPPLIGGTLAPTGPALTSRRPADALRGWAGQLTGRVGIPATALEAYGYAELVLAQTDPTCGLKWTTLAAIGKIESAHGSAKGATLLADGRSSPTIFGPPLNGTNNTMAIKDTDRGVLDGDQTWDRAVGPMQFIPTTWQSHAVDADNDGMNDPGDIDDAALASANYLCQRDRNMSLAGDWWAAILSYNAVPSYAQAVYQAANEYGLSSRP